MFEVNKISSTNKTVRMPNPLIEKLTKLAKQNDVSFNQLVVQCCEYAMKHLDSKI